MNHSIQRLPTGLMDELLSSVAPPTFAALLNALAFPSQDPINPTNHRQLSNSLGGHHKDAPTNDDFVSLQHLIGENITQLKVPVVVGDPSSLGIIESHHAIFNVIIKDLTPNVTSIDMSLSAVLEAPGPYLQVKTTLPLKKLNTADYSFGQSIFKMTQLKSLKITLPLNPTNELFTPAEYIISSNDEIITTHPSLELLSLHPVQKETYENFLKHSITFPSLTTLDLCDSYTSVESYHAFFSWYSSSQPSPIPKLTKLITNNKNINVNLPAQVVGKYFTQSPLFSQITELALGSVISEDELKEFFSSTHFSSNNNITTLMLKGLNALSPALFEWMTMHANGLSQLTSLDLSQSEVINDDCIKQLCESPVITKLVSLDLSKVNQLTNRSVELIAKSPNMTELRHITLSYWCDIVGMKEFAQETSKVTKLQTLSTEFSDCSDIAAFQCLFNSPNLSNLTSLELMGCSGFNQDHWVTLARSHAMRNLSKLDLSFSHNYRRPTLVRDPENPSYHMKEFFTSPNLTNITKIDLKACDLHDSDFEFFGVDQESGIGKNLQWLDISSNAQITDQTLRKLSTRLNNLYNLTTINITRTGITSDGLVRFIQGYGDELPRGLVIVADDTVTNRAQIALAYLKIFSPLVQQYLPPTKSLED